MADLTLTPASVVPGSTSRQENGIAGETIAAGKVVYKQASTGKYMLADDNGASAEMKIPTGIALNGASLNQPVSVHKSGDITIGATIVAGTSYYLSDTPGGICPFADLLAGENVALIGIGKSTTVLLVNITVPGVTL